MTHNEKRNILKNLGLVLRENSLLKYRQEAVSQEIVSLFMPEHITFILVEVDDAFADVSKQLND